MRLLLVLALAGIVSAAEWTLYACAATTKGYVVGAKLLPSGLFRRTSEGWQHVAHNHPFLFAAEQLPEDGANVYAAAGNGLLRIPRQGKSWTILTAEDVTELRDLAVDAQGTLYFGHSAGIRMSTDRGFSWKEISGNLPRKYTEAIRADQRRSGVLLSGGEDGVWRTEDSGQTWRRAGASGFQILRIQQSPHDPCFWLAGSQSGGLFASRDCGATFENSGNIGVNKNIYDIAFDSGTRIALAVWGTGVVVSEDDGKTWQTRGRSLPSDEIWSVVFDPSKPGRLFASVHEQAIYVSEDAGATWKKDGLEGSLATRLKFFPDKDGR